MNPAATPAPVEDVQGDARWMSMHHRFLHFAKEKEPEVVFVGDSLIQQFSFTPMWEKILVPLHSLNIGVGGDQTQHVLWRISEGELDDISPKVIVLLVGTNNHGHTAEQVVGGILEIVRVIHTKQPQAQIVVMGLPPRGHRPNKLRTKIQDINEALLDQLDDREGVQFFPVDPSLFINKDGEIDHNDMYDYLHFTKQGYQKLMEPLVEEVQTLLKNFLTADTVSTGDPDLS